MEIEVKAKKFGGSIGVVIPREIVIKQRIHPDDTLKMKVEKVADLSFMWGICKDVKISTDKIMEEIDEGEDD